MTTLSSSFFSLIKRFRDSGLLTLLAALLAETLLLGYGAFLVLFSIETLLPTFITVRLSLTKVFFFLLLGTGLLALMTRFLDLTYPLKEKSFRILLMLGLFWGTGILTLSLIKFPLLSLPFIIIGFLVSGKLFWGILSEEAEY